MQTPARNLEHAWNVIQDRIQGLLWPKQLWIIIVYVPDGEKRKHFSAQVHMTNHVIKIKGSTCSLYQMIYDAVCWFIIRSSLTSTGGFNETSAKADKNVKYLDTKQAITKRLTWNSSKKSCSTTSWTPSKTIWNRILLYFLKSFLCKQIWNMDVLYFKKCICLDKPYKVNHWRLTVNKT